MGSPSPIPRGLVVQNGEKTFSFKSGAIPLPLSRTVTTTPLARLPWRIGFAASMMRGLFRPESASAALATRWAKASARAVSSPSTLGRSLGQGLFLRQGFLGRQFVDDGDGAKRRVLIAKPARFD